MRLLTELSVCQYGDLSIPVAEVTADLPDSAPRLNRPGVVLIKDWVGNYPVLVLVLRCSAELSVCQYGDLSISVAEVQTDLSRLSTAAE